MQTKYHTYTEKAILFIMLQDIWLIELDLYRERNHSNVKCSFGSISSWYSAGGCFIFVDMGFGISWAHITSSSSSSSWHYIVTSFWSFLLWLLLWTCRWTCEWNRAIWPQLNDWIIWYILNRLTVFVDFWIEVELRYSSLVV